MEPVHHCFDRVTVSAMTEITIDSAMSHEAACVDAEDMCAPSEIHDQLEVLDVQYFGFDDRVHAGQIVMNKSVAADVRDFFACAYELQFPIAHVIPISDLRYAWDDERSCNDNNSSGYNYRYILGKPERLSNHARGLAFDINPVQNIFARYAKSGEETYRLPADGVYDENAPGTLTRDHALVRMMKERGWTWGGDWTKEANGVVDYQHFEKQSII